MEVRWLAFGTVLVPGVSLAASRKKRRPVRPQVPSARPAAEPLPATPVVPLQARARTAPSRWVLLCVLVLTLGLHLWGIRHDLPYITEDPVFVTRALSIAASGDLNPHWFGHPGSTIIYPMAAAMHVWNALANGRSLFGADPQLRSQFGPPEFYLFGRLLTVVYAIFSVLLVYLIGRDSFGERAALVGALFAAVYPTEVFDKMVRTDSASLCFGLLGLWRCLRVLDQPTLRNQILAGAAIGLAISTKYYMGTVVGVLILVDGLVLRRTFSRRQAMRPVCLQAAAGLGAVALGFALTTPYFLLDHANALKSLQTELRTSHIGQDGLSPTQNLRWYVTEVLPSTVGWPQLLVAGVGLALVLRQRRWPQLLLLLFALEFLVAVSLSSLHWGRWLIPILPVFALIAAHGLCGSIERLSDILKLGSRWQPAFIAAGALLLAWQLAYWVMQTDALHANPSTHVLAREWMEEHLPARSHIAYEWETLPPPLKYDKGPVVGILIDHDRGREFTEVVISMLSSWKSLDLYRQQGVKYLVTSSLYYDFYPAHAGQYPTDAAFYRALLETGHLIYQVEPSPDHEGTGIRIYAIQ